jgi:hypothetical protein
MPAYKERLHAGARTQVEGALDRAPNRQLSERACGRADAGDEIGFAGTVRRVGRDREPLVCLPVEVRL